MVGCGENPLGEIKHWLKGHSTFIKTQPVINLIPRGGEEKIFPMGCQENMRKGSNFQDSCVSCAGLFVKPNITRHKIESWKWEAFCTV
jgi:hypothetical protein